MEHQREEEKDVEEKGKNIFHMIKSSLSKTWCFNDISGFNR